MYCSIVVVATFSLFSLSVGTSLRVKDPCFRHQCEPGQNCVPDQKQCKRDPCPQYICEDEDPCADGPCRRREQCIRRRIQCLTTPCPQYICKPFDPCSVKECEEGHECMTTQCKALHCRPKAVCVKIPGYGSGKSCPAVKRTGFSTCDIDINDCRESGCKGGKICCPNSKGCGGTSCQFPV